VTVVEIEKLIAEVEAIADDGARERARSLVSAVLDLHGEALARIVDEVRRLGGEASLRELAREDAVGCVLSIHELYEPEPVLPTPPAPSPSRPEAPPAGFVPIERLRARRSPAQEDETDRCDLCSAVVAERHDHLIDPQSRELRCACVPCASLFGADRAGRWKRVRPRVDRLDGFQLGDDAWNSLGIPIDLAFFFRSSRDARVVAMYPSPAGATESLLSLDAWTRIETDNPVLRDLEDDVEALLVRRGRGEREHYRVSIDACYALVGRIRANWRGLGGGAEVWTQIGDFFEDLRQSTRPRSAYA
jgi:Family of unknown function (DUF5947)